MFGSEWDRERVGLESFGGVDGEVVGDPGLRWIRSRASKSERVYPRISAWKKLAMDHFAHSQGDEVSAGGVRGGEMKWDPRQEVG